MIQIKKANRGLFHREMGIPQGEKVPAATIAKAKESTDPKIRKQATFAQNAAKWSK